MRRLAATTIALAMLLSACTSEPSTPFEVPDEDPLMAPSATTEPTEPEPDEIDVTRTPDTITEEWVQAVINTIYAELGAVYGEVLAGPVGEENSSDTYDARLERSFAGAELDAVRDELTKIIVDDAGIRSQLLPPDEYTGLRYEVVAVPFVEPGCIVAITRVNTEGTAPNGGPLPTLVAISLSPRAEPENVPTAWVVRDNLINEAPDGTPNADEVMLNASLADYGTSLDNTCGDA